MPLPCRFQLHRYPFGNQLCHLNFWIDNINGVYKLKPSDYYKNGNNTIHFYGRHNLGEYAFINSTYKLQTPYNRSVSVLIDIDSYYGYHVLNSFTPSSLMALISYATLYFNISDFNERIMVSLTSLLVLAALFANANDSSVMTPYFKMLDIWFVTMIIFCFIIVIVNTVIRRLISQEFINKEHFMIKESDENMEDLLGDRLLRRAKKFNDVFKIFYPILLIVFLVIFILYAAEVL